MTHRTDCICMKCVSARYDALDAKRYRWLRHGDNDEKVIINCLSVPFLLRNEQLDKAIDAELARK